MTEPAAYPYQLGEILTAPVNARFDAEAVWDGARLAVSPAEVSNKLASVFRDGPTLPDILPRFERGTADDVDVGRLLAISRWLLNRPVRGPKVRARFYDLLVTTASEAADRSLEDTDIFFARMATWIRELPVSARDRDESATLGELFPDIFLFRTGGAQQTLKLARTPPSAFDLIDPVREIALLHADPTGAGEIGDTNFKGCSPCRPDPSSSLGGVRYCIRPGSEGLEECRWPPPEPEPLPEPNWEYVIQVGNSWWTTIIGVWHGSAYTRTIKRISSYTVPWTVPEISVCIFYAQEVAGPFEDICFSWLCPGGTCQECNTNGPDYEATVSDTVGSVFPSSPWGVNSKHFAAGRQATYCDGRWRWS